MTFLRNCWYLAAWSGEVDGGGLLARTILDEELVLFRDQDGVPAALADRCPHRFAPLSHGVVEDGHIRCGYHGLVFDRAGRCILNPHGEGAVPPRARVSSYPVVERHEAIWIWMGDAGACDPARIPDLSFISATPASAKYQFKLSLAADYRLISDNILDLSHTDFLHPGTLSSGGKVAGSIPDVRVEGECVRAEWLVDDEPPIGVFAPYFPPGERVHGWMAVDWRPAAVMVLRSGASTAERSVSVKTAHVMTPESENRAHYFFCSTRDFETENPDYNSFARDRVFRVFSEQDGPMIEAVQRKMGTAELWSLEPAILSSDRGAVRARRVLEKLIRDEQEGPAEIIETLTAGDAQRMAAGSLLGQA